MIGPELTTVVRRTPVAITLEATVSRATVVGTEGALVTPVATAQRRCTTVLAHVRRAVAPVGKRAVGAILTALEPVTMRTCVIRPSRALAPAVLTRLEPVGAPLATVLTTVKTTLGCAVETTTFGRTVVTTEPV